MTIETIFLVWSLQLFNNNVLLDDRELIIKKHLSGAKHVLYCVMFKVLTKYHKLLTSLAGPHGVVSVQSTVYS